MFETDGTIYKGNWRKGDKHGTGEFRKANGEVIKGKWRYGK